MSIAVLKVFSVMRSVYQHRYEIYEKGNSKARQMLTYFVLILLMTTSTAYQGKELKSS